MGNDDGDRPKKSWREIDRARESGRRDDSRERGGNVLGNERSAAYRAYKSQLDRLFDGGAKAGAPKVDEAAIAAQLDSGDEALVLEALGTIERLHGEGTLKRAAALKARLKTVQATIDDPTIQNKARALLEKL
ncbi:MAG: hypothetical protein ACAI38_19790 [Myxococcota bacterium]